MRSSVDRPRRTCIVFLRSRLARRGPAHFSAMKRLLPSARGTRGPRGTHVDVRRVERDMTVVVFTVILKRAPAPTYKLHDSRFARLIS